MTPALRMCGLAALAALQCAGQAAEALDRTLVKRAFERLYNFNFAAAHQAADSHIATHPEDPMGYAVRGASYLFYELDRLRILESEFFTDDKKLAGKTPLKPDPSIRNHFQAAVADTERAASTVRSRDPSDTHALFALCMAEGMRTDYTAFVERRQLRSLPSARSSNSYAVQLLKIDPEFADAYLTTGLTEYLVGSLPFFVRWFVRFDGVQGDKKIAEANLKKVARRGRYLGPFAEILLSIYYLREKQPRMSIVILENLVGRYPENPLFKKELRLLSAKYPGPAIRSADGND